MNKAGQTVIRASELTFGFVHGKLVLDEVNFSIKHGSKMTIMGQNGSGKSTIIKLIDSTLKPIAGTINKGVGLKVATAQQVLPASLKELKVIDYFQKHLPPDRSIEVKIAKVLEKVHLRAPLDRQVKSFSGGEQARLLLAATLIQEPDILLLDEPTNNLDIKGISILTELMQSFEDTCIVVSHDEKFLNSFTDGVLYLDNFSHKIEQHTGDYNDVKVNIQERIKKENSENARLEKIAKAKKDQANVFANKGGGMRKVAKKMKEVAAEMESKVVTVRKEDKALRPFIIPLQPNISSSGSKLAEISAVTLPAVRNSEPIKLLSPIVLGRQSILLLRGPNGIGKTTFLEALTENTAKGCKIANGVRVGYYRQDFSTLDYDALVIDSLMESATGSGVTEQSVRQVAAAFLIGRDQVNQEIGSLSEGQKGLLSFAQLVLSEPGILILDEPTNHINFRHIPAIASAIKNFQGAVILVSHDAAFVKSIPIQQELDLDDIMF